MKTQPYTIHAIVKYFYPIAAGIETNMLETYSKIAASGVDVTIHTSKDDYVHKDCLPDKEQIKGMKVRRYSFKLWGFWPKFDWSDSDVVALHNFDMFPHLSLLLYVWWLKKGDHKNFKLVITPHGGFNPEWSVFKRWQVLIKRTYHNTLGAWLINNAADGVRAVSEWERREMIKCGIKPELIEVISNGVEDDAYKDVSTLASQEIKDRVKRWGKYIVQVGRVYPIKNYQTPIRALAELPEDIKFVIVGPVEKNQHAGYLQQLLELVKQLGLEDRVVFAGVIRGVDKYYVIKQSLMMVHMALWESFCNVVHEGMSQGKICIVADNTALPLLIKDGVNGYCVATMDYQALTKKIQHVLDDSNSSKLKSMAKQAQEFGLQTSWQAVAKKMDSWHRRLISE
jgi:glycosyltransferase involved in cell wall biosynthesis